MRITTATQLLRHMRTCFPRDAYSASSRKSFARIIVHSDNTLHNPKTGHLEPRPDAPRWILRAIATKAKQSNAEKNRVRESWQDYHRRQKVLLTGLDCLAGQGDLFE